MSIYIRNIVSKVGIGIGLFLFAIVYINVFYLSMCKNIKIIPCIIILIILLAILLKFSNKTVFHYMMFGMILEQLVIGIFCMVEYSTWDVYALYKNAVSLAKGGSFNSAYFEIYPHNIMLLFILTILYKISYTIFGSTSQYFGMLLNVFSIDSAIFFSLKIVEKLSGERIKYQYGILCALFSPLYLWVPIVYTDTICLPFLTGSILLLFNTAEKLSQQKEVDKRIAFRFVLFGFVAAFGMKIKGSLAIIIVAGIIYIILKFNAFSKNNMFKVLKVCILCTIGMLLCMLMFGTLIKSTGLFTMDGFEKYEFPKTHFIMMGLQGMGNFNADDKHFTESIEGYDNKKEAIAEKIEERVSEMGVKGVIKQMFNKAINVFCNP